MAYTKHHWKERFEALRRLVSERGRVVTIEDVKNSEGIKSKGAAHYTLTVWEKMGLVKKEGSQWRMK